MKHAATNEDLVISRPGYTLPSTIAWPASEGAAPCIVFFAGSGPTDRDWTSPLLAGKNGSGAQLALELQATIAGANHVYKSETPAPATISQGEIVAGYADDGHALAAGLVDAIVGFVTAE